MFTIRTDFLILTLFSLLNFNEICESAKILGVFPFPAKSHYILGNGLMKGLAEKGHDVTMVSPHVDSEPPRNGSYKTVHLNGFWEEYFEVVAAMGLMVHVDENSVLHQYMAQEYILKFNEKFLEHPNTQALLKSGETYDLVILEKFYNDALLPFGHHFGAPLILFSAIGTSPCTNVMTGNPEPYAYVPHFSSSYTTDMSFFQRLTNSWLYLAQELLDHWYFLPKQELTMKKYFPNSPSLKELYHNASILFTSTHESYALSVPLVPNVVPLGGFHVKPAKKLPNDVKKIMDGAKYGVVYVSLGSNLKITEMPLKEQKEIMAAFGKLKETVLVKWDSEVPDWKPDNVHLRKWWPQSDLLAHPNVKLFITHAGLLSLTETIYHGVPVLLIPFFGDQHHNAQLAVSNGYGLKLPYHSFSTEKFALLVNELLINSSYRKNAKRISKLFHDRPQKPMDLANYWVEYVIRHGGAPHLRVKGAVLPWYKYFLVDVILFVSAVILVVFKIIGLVVRKLVNKGNKVKKMKKS